MQHVSQDSVLLLPPTVAECKWAVCHILAPSSDVFSLICERIYEEWMPLKQLTHSHSDYTVRFVLFRLIS